MPGRRKPTELLQLAGAFKKNPQRRRAIGPKSPRELGAPPAHLSDAERECWREIAANAPAGVLTSAERWTVEIAAGLMAKRRDAGLTAAEGALLIKTQSLLGLTSVDRSRVTGDASDDEQPSPYDEFIQ